MDCIAMDLVLADATLRGTFSLLLGDPESQPPALAEFLLDCFYALPDVLLEFAAEAFAYLGSDNPLTIQLVGPVSYRKLSSSAPLCRN